MSYAYGMNAWHRLASNGIGMMLGMLVVAQACPAFGGQKIRFSNPPVQNAPGTVDLKNNPSLAPENLVGFKRNADVASDILDGQVRPQGNSTPEMDKRRLQELEDRKNWLSPSTKDTDGPQTRDNNSSARREDSPRRDDPRTEKTPVISPELEKAFNPNGRSSDPRRGMDREQERKTLDKPQDGSLASRIPTDKSGIISRPGGLNGELAAPRMGTSFQEREALHKADAERFQNLLAPTPIAGAGGNRFGDGALGPSGQRISTGPGLPGGLSSGSAASAPGQLGSRPFDGGATLAPGQLGGQNGLGQPLSPGFRPPEQALGPPPKPPAILEIPKRNQ